MQNREQTGSGFLDHFLDKTDLDSDSSDNDDQDDNNIGLRLWFWLGSISDHYLQVFLRWHISCRLQTYNMLT
jgi:hypothetical protein